MPRPAEVLAQVYSLRGLWFLPTPLDVPDSCLVLQRSLALAHSLRGCLLYLLLCSSQSQVCSSLGHRLSPVSVNVPGLNLLPLTQSSLSQSCSCEVHHPRPVPAQVAGSVLPSQMSLVWIHSHSYSVHHPRPALAHSGRSVLLLWSLLLQVCSGPGPWFSPAFTNVPGLDPLTLL